MAKSYFAILGISSNATADEIKSAYRRLAKEFHPDHYTGGSKTFQEIQKAYAVLGNAGRRREYEQKIRRVSPKTPVRPTTYSEPEPLIPEERPVDVGEVSPVRSFQSFTPSFDEIFDWLWNNFSDLTAPKSGRVQNLTLEVTLTPEQARRGGNARVMVPAQAVCPTCRGHGGIGPYECVRCAGDRRKLSIINCIPERRIIEDRRSGQDRRRELRCRDCYAIERRDAFRSIHRKISYRQV